MREFATAVKRAEPDPDVEVDVVEFVIAGQEFASTIPSTGQISILLASRGLGNNMRAIHDFLKRHLVGDGYDRLVKLLDDGTIPFDLLMGGDDLNPDGGIIDSIIEEAVGRPTQPPSDSSASPNSAGQRSTGRSRGAGSTGSTSPQTAS